MKLSPRQRRAIKRVPRFVPPIAIARELGVTYTRTIEHWRAIVKHTITDRWAHNPDARFIRGDMRPSRIDASPWVRDKLHKLTLDVAEDVRSPVLVTSIDNASRRVDAKVYKYTNALVPISIRNTDIGPKIDAFRRENLDKIKSLSSTLVGELGDYLSEAEMGGYDVERMAKHIEDRFNVSASKADLLARDQTLKLSGQITRERQTQAGIERYVWSTSRDERVRDEHALLEGETFTWGDPPEVGEPGQDFQCRCIAIPVLPAIEDLEDAPQP